VQGTQLAERQQNVSDVQEHLLVVRTITGGCQVGQDDHLLLLTIRAAVQRHVRVQEPREQRKHGSWVGGARGQHGQQTGIEHVLVVELFMHVHHGRHVGVRVLHLDHHGHAARRPLGPGQRDRAENDIGRELVVGQNCATAVDRAERHVFGAGPECPVGRGPREHDRAQVIHAGLTHRVVVLVAVAMIPYRGRIKRRNKRSLRVWCIE